MGRPVRIQSISINSLNDAFKKLEREIYSSSGGGGDVTFPITIEQGGTGQTSSSSSFKALAASASTYGSLLAYDNSGNWVTVAPGSGGQVLTRNTGALSGVSWETPTDAGGVWGAITGTLSNQTDLVSALALKANLASPTFTGTVTTISTTEQSRTGHDSSNYFSCTTSSAGVTTFLAVGTAPQFVFTRNINDNVTLAVLNQQNASATGLLLDLQLAGSTKFNISQAGNIFTAGGLVVNGGAIATNLTAANGNFYAIGSASFPVTTSTYLLSGWTGVNFRIAERGTTNTVVNVGYSYASHIIGQQTYTEGASGTHPFAGQLLIRALVGTNGSASTTDAATLCIEGAMTGVTTSGFNDSFRVIAGTSRFGGIHIFDSTVTTGGTTGAQTINKPSGTVNFAAAATTLVVTNSMCNANSIVLAVIRTNDTTATIKNVVPTSGAFTITLTAAATAETSVGFIVYN